MRIRKKVTYMFLEQKVLTYNGRVVFEKITMPYFQRIPKLFEKNEACFFIQENLDDVKFGNKELSRQMTISESQLNRKIKALSGKTLSLFIRSIRLQKAKVLLQTTDLNKSEIAYNVGFTNPAYFSHTFSKEFGVVPSLFRN